MVVSREEALEFVEGERGCSVIVVKGCCWGAGWGGEGGIRGGGVRCSIE